MCIKKRSRDDAENIDMKFPEFNNGYVSVLVFYYYCTMGI